MKRFGTDSITAQYKNMDSQCRAAVDAFFVIRRNAYLTVEILVNFINM